MKKHDATLAALILQITTAPLALAAGLQTTAQPGGGLLGKYHRLTIPQSGFVLDGPTDLSVDELIINGPVVTKGHRLRIDARKLVFGAEGKIIAFTEPAAKGADGREGASTLPAAPAEKIGRRGHTGHTPTTEVESGQRGQDGLKQPSEVLVFAAQTEGKVVVIGQGQQGGQGGTGGKGGKGGQGGEGGPSEAQCWPVGDTPAGQGGTGGMGQRGGEGGPGANGGNGVDVTMLVGYQNPQGPFPHLVSEGGDGGLPGLGGEGGDGGDGGEGGRGSSAWCGLTTDEMDKGESGGQGAKGPKGYDSTVAGKKGAPGKLAHKSYGKLELARYQVFTAFFDFHVSRTLHFLFEKSLGLTLSQVESRKQIAELLASDSDIDPATDPRVALLVESDAESSNEVIKVWKQYFIDPIDETLKGSPAGTYSKPQQARLENSLAHAKSIVALLESLKKSSEAQAALPQLSAKLDELLLGGKSAFESDLNLALRSCNVFNKAKQAVKDEYLAHILGATAHYELPPCSKSPDFSNPKNAFEPIVLVASLPAPSLGDPLRGWLEQVEALPAVTPVSLNSGQSLLYATLERLVRAGYDLLGIGEAHARDARVILAGRHTLTARELEAQKPKFSPLTNYGALVGYEMPRNVERSTDELAYHLRTIAHLLGVSQ